MIRYLGRAWWDESVVGYCEGVPVRGDFRPGRGDCVLYRHWGDRGRMLLYVGRSEDFGARTVTHRLSSWWWPVVDLITVVGFQDLEELKWAEGCAIRSESPVGNLVGNSGYRGGSRSAPVRGRWAS